MHAKNGRWGWPRLHLSTAVILFLLGSVALGAQFIRRKGIVQIETNGSKVGIVSVSDDRPFKGIEDGFYPENEFGLPYTILETGIRFEDKASGTRLYSDGYSWNYKAALGNAVVLVTSLAVFAFLLERRIRRRGSSG